MITCKFDKGRKLWLSLDKNGYEFFSHEEQKYSWQRCRIMARREWQKAQLTPRRKDGDYCTYTPNSY
jgi:hypothetical protein